LRFSHSPVGRGGGGENRSKIKIKIRCKKGGIKNNIRSTSTLSLAYSFSPRLYLQELSSSESNSETGLNRPITEEDTLNIQVKPSQDNFVQVIQ
jgi:hypothetical protein